MTISAAMKKALRKVARRRHCAHWLIPKNTLRALLRRRLVVPCGFYSVCLPSDRPTFPVAIFYANPETAFDR